MDFRDEIVEGLKARADLYKWKIILVAGLGAAGSGLVGTSHKSQWGYLLALIPWICAYVDLLSKDQTLRIVALTRYLYLVSRVENKKENYLEYVAFVREADTMPHSSLWAGLEILRSRIKLVITRKSTTSAYAFEALAQHWSTVALAFGVIVWGWVLGLGCRVGLMLFFNSFAALIVSLIVYLAYVRRRDAVDRLSLPNGRAASAHTSR
jgi:hypothetical protein